MELLAQGWTLNSACREVGVVRTTGHNWKGGSRVRLRDGTVKLVPPLGPLSTCELSARFLSASERVQIAYLASQGLGPTAIGLQLGRAASTISRELRRNRHPSGPYRPATHRRLPPCAADDPRSPSSPCTRHCTSSSARSCRHGVIRSRSVAPYGQPILMTR